MAETPVPLWKSEMADIDRRHYIVGCYGFLLVAFGIVGLGIMVMFFD